MLQTAMTALATPQKIYDAKTTTLSNGMEVFVVENKRTPAVTHMVWYRIGGADEAMGHSGLAHYLEHLMFKGTDTMPAGEFSKRVKSWGGNDNAFTSWDFTAYFQTIPKAKLEDVMRMEADRMVNLNFDDEDALTERDVVIQERKQRTDSSPSAQLNEAMRATLFVNHPYARPIIGWDAEIRDLTPQAARDFYETYYAPQNAILVVSGDVKADDVFAKAEKIYGSLSNDTAVERPEWPDVPNIYGQQMVTHHHASVQQRVWRRLHRVPGMGNDYQTALAFSLADEIIGGNTGRLYQALVVDQQLASATGFSYGGIAVDDSTISIAVTPLDKISFDQIEAATLDVLTDIADNGLSEEEVSAAISRMQDTSVYERDSLTGPAMMIGYQLASGLSIDQVESWIHELESVTAADIQAAVQAYILPSSEQSHFVTGHLIPETE